MNPRNLKKVFWGRLSEQIAQSKLSVDWLRGQDLNLRPLGYEPNELPGCSTPHFQYIANEGFRSMDGQTSESVKKRLCVAGRNPLHKRNFFGDKGSA
jgi:hypothetical protein